MRILSTLSFALLPVVCAATTVQAQSTPIAPSLVAQAKAGDAQAQHDFGVALREGTGGRRDVAEAYTWFKRAADQGHACACYDLGMCYATGAGVRADPKLAVDWFRKAAAKDQPDALFNLGVAYHEGLGIEKDLAKATACFIKAAKLGNPDGMYDAAIAYANGEGIEQDRGTAFEWFKKASESGVENAKAWMESLHKKGFGLPGVENGSGIVHGPNHAYGIQAPKGWVIDNAIWADQGVFDVFYEAGKTLDESRVVGFSRVQAADKEGIEAHIKADLELTVQGAPAAKCERQAALKTKDGMTAICYRITGVPGKYPELVAYINAPTVVILVSVSVRESSRMKAGESLLQELVGSITWFSDKVVYTP